MESPVKPELRVAEAVAFLRTRAGLSQRALSQRAGLSDGLVSKIERREIADPTFATVARLMCALDMTAAEINYLVVTEARGMVPDAVTPPRLNGPRRCA